MTKVRNHLGQFLSERVRRAEAGVVKSMILGASHASVFTPVDTSVLLNSQYRRLISNGNEIRGQVGYTAAYAKWVHDPDVKQVFRRATAKKEFLSEGFAEAAPVIKAVIKEALKP